MSSAQQRFPAYVSERRKAAAGTHNVQARIRRSGDVPGQAAHYACTEMRDPDAALATVRTHVSHAMTKLGVRDRAQLVVLAYETGLVRPNWLT